MTTRMKIFLRLKAQEIGIALAVIAVIVLIGFGFYKLSNAYSDWIVAESSDVSKITYFLINPVSFTLEAVSGELSGEYETKHSFYEYTTSSLFFQSLWTLTQWVLFLGTVGMIPLMLGFLTIDWIKANWHKAGILSGEIEVKKRKRKSK
jgi:hypothetical protein